VFERVGDGIAGTTLPESHPDDDQKKCDDWQQTSRGNRDKKPTASQIKLRTNRSGLVQNVQAVQPLRSAQAPSFILPRDAGEEQRWGFGRFELFERLELQCISCQFPAKIF
jgi:hypothetical protein